ncbi:MAG: hypothetical protein SF029_09445 [bacterium]|nr:hypothetical protein [bacterium]
MQPINPAFPEEQDVSIPVAPRQGGFGRWIIWIVALSLVMVFAALNIVSMTIRDLNMPLEAEMAQMEEQLLVTLPPSDQEQALSSTLVAIQEQIVGLQPVQTELAADHLDWPTAMQHISNYDPALLTLHSIAQAENRITLNGQASDEAVVTAYADALKTCGLFARVTVQSIALRAVPTPTPPLVAAQDAPQGVTGSPSEPLTEAYFVEFVLILERV